MSGSGFDSLASRRVILFADLVESVRLYERFEASTIDRWRRFCATVRGQLAPALNGRLVRTVGDGLLLDFPTPAEAVRAAFALHQEIAVLNSPPSAEAADDDMRLRIGLHAAEVVVDDHDLWGSGVNLAARLAAVALPGQTVASAAVRTALDDGVHAAIQDLGHRHLKHMVEPVRAFALADPAHGHAVQAPRTEDLRPAVAVVPFVAMPSDPTHDALGHAVADDVIASLSRHGGLRVLSRHSTAAVRGTALDLPRLRQLLGASFLLSGHFYVHNQRVRLSAELCELDQGRVLWAGSVSGQVDAIFEGQDEIVPHLVAQVSQQVLAHELGRVRSLPLDALASYSLLLGAHGLLHSLVPSDNERSRELLEHLAERHPRHAAPHAVLSEWHIVQFSQGRAGNPLAAISAAQEQAERAMERDPTQPDALVALGVACAFSQRDYAAAAAHYRKALEADPGHPQAWARLSESLSEAGEHPDALAAAQRAIALSPLDPRRFFYECAAARTAYMMGRYGLAREHAAASIRMNALHAPAHRLLIAAQWQSGEEEAARRSAQDYLRLLPGANTSGSPLTGQAPQAPSPFARILHAAGVPL